MKNTKQVSRAEAARRSGCVPSTVGRLKAYAKAPSSSVRQNNTLPLQELPTSWCEEQIFSWVQGSYVQEYPGSINSSLSAVLKAWPNDL